MASANSAVRGNQDERDMDGPSITAASQQLDSEWTSIQVPRQISGRTLRRSCDRCHQQKLRCVGSKTTLQACARCQRVGAECIYNARSSKQANKNKGGNHDGGQTEPVTPVMNHQSSNYGAFDPEQLQLDSFFPSAWDAMNIPSMTDPALTTHTHSSSASILSTSTGPVFSTKSSIDENVIPTQEVCKSGGDPCARLASVCQTLESLLKTVTSERTGQGEQFPVGEVFCAFESFVRAMALDRGRARTPSRDAHTSFDKYMESKQAAMAAQCYMVCMRLVVSLSEKMLQNLLASPVPVQRTSFGLSSPDSTQFNSGALGTLDMNFSLGNQDMIENYRLEDLYVGPTDSYEQAVDSSVNMLRIGTRLIGRMEQLLEIPPDMAGGTISAAEQASIDQQRRKRSLPARLVATTWEHETSIGNKCAVTYFRRYRAAILGLAQSHA